MATEAQIPEMPRVKLGSQGLEVSKLGFGCMGLNGIYNSPVAEEEGITFFDTSAIYGLDHANEIMVGKALKHLPREKIRLATKFGIFKFDSTQVVIKGRPEYVRSCCEASLKRLNVEYIDLYYQHRVDITVPIEDTGAHPRFTRQYLEQNKILCTRIEALAKGYGCTPAQLALAWVLHQGDDTVPIPGTTKIKNLDDNVGSVRVKLTESDLKEISDAVPINEVAGPRTIESFLRLSWKFADTPPKASK
ncbi:hypothetical protein RJ639_002288 [Escallonia herrerae]|uniref:NADP-dependent oxidoreductase domain-containing protein n=1 Tax=Escallonia herrerae TaxID=1293975 RepID=A0AA88XGJ3_9ASTE|nr:hypothetical protein RJ639_002288 [Escallonia herrerae]